MNNFNFLPRESDDSINRSSILEDLKSFTQDLKQLNGKIKTDLTVFDSGAIMLDVFCQNRTFILVYSPTTGFGVDEVKEDDGFDLSYKFYAKDINTAKEKLKELIIDPSS